MQPLTPEFGLNDFHIVRMMWRLVALVFLANHVASVPVTCNKTYPEHLAWKKPTYRILTVGHTGVGKSTLIDMFAGGHEIAKVGTVDGLSETEDTCSLQFDWKYIDAQERWECVDTPGLADTAGRNHDIQNAEEMQDRLRTVGPVDAVVLVFKVTEKFTEETMAAILFLRMYFGPSVWQHMIVVYTFWPWSICDDFGCQPNQNKLSDEHEKVMQYAFEYLLSPDVGASDPRCNETVSFKCFPKAADIPFIASDVYMKKLESYREQHNCDLLDPQAPCVARIYHGSPNTASEIQKVRGVISQRSEAYGYSTVNMSRITNYWLACEKTKDRIEESLQHANPTDADIANILLDAVLCFTGGFGQTFADIRTFLDVRVDLQLRLAEAIEDQGYDQILTAEKGFGLYRKCRRATALGREPEESAMNAVTCWTALQQAGERPVVLRERQMLTSFYQHLHHLQRLAVTLKAKTLRAPWGHEFAMNVSTGVEKQELELYSDFKQYLACQPGAPVIGTSDSLEGPWCNFARSHWGIESQVYECSVRAISCFTNEPTLPKAISQASASYLVRLAFGVANISSSHIVDVRANAVAFLSSNLFSTDLKETAAGCTGAKPIACQSCRGIKPEVASRFIVDSTMPAGAMKLPGVEWLAFAYKLNGKPVFEQVEDGDAKDPIFRFLYTEGSEWMVSDSAQKKTFYAPKNVFASAPPWQWTCDKNTLLTATTQGWTLSSLAAQMSGVKDASSHSESNSFGVTGPTWGQVKELLSMLGPEAEAATAAEDAADKDEKNKDKDKDKDEDKDSKPIFSADFGFSSENALMSAMSKASRNMKGAQSQASANTFTASYTGQLYTATMSFAGMSWDSFHPCFKMNLGWLNILGWPFRETRLVIDRFGEYSIDKVGMGARFQVSGADSFNLDKDSLDSFRSKVSQYMDHTSQHTSAGVDLGFFKFSHEDTDTRDHAENTASSSQERQRQNLVRSVKSYESKSFGAMAGCVGENINQPVPSRYAVVPIYSLPLHTIEVLAGSDVKDILRAHVLLQFLKGRACNRQLLGPDWKTAGVCHFDGQNWVANLGICNDTYVWNGQTCVKSCALSDLGTPSGQWEVSGAGFLQAPSITLTDNRGVSHEQAVTFMSSGRQEIELRVPDGELVTMYIDSKLRNKPYFKLPSSEPYATCAQGEWLTRYNWRLPEPRGIRSCSSCGRCVHSHCVAGSELEGQLWADCYESFCGGQRDTDCGYLTCNNWQNSKSCASDLCSNSNCCSGHENMDIKGTMTPYYSKITRSFSQVKSTVPKIYNDLKRNYPAYTWLVAAWSTGYRSAGPGECYSTQNYYGSYCTGVDNNHMGLWAAGVWCPYGLDSVEWENLENSVKSCTKGQDTSCVTHYATAVAALDSSLSGKGASSTTYWYGDHGQSACAVVALPEKYCNWDGPDCARPDVYMKSKAIFAMQSSSSRSSTFVEYSLSAGDEDMNIRATEPAHGYSISNGTPLSTEATPLSTEAMSFLLHRRAGRITSVSVSTAPEPTNESSGHPQLFIAMFAAASFSLVLGLVILRLTRKSLPDRLHSPLLDA